MGYLTEMARTAKKEEEIDMTREETIRVTILIVLSGSIALFFGCIHENYHWHDVVTVEEYDVATDTVIVKASMPEYSDGGSATALSGQIYVIGGLLSSDEPPPKRVLKYDIASDVWTQVADIPTAPGEGVAVCSAGGKIYAIGGNRHLAVWHAVQQYDPATDAWTRKADMQYGRTNAPVAVVDDKIYVFGGSSLPNSVECYDPATDTWSLRADMPTGRGGAVAEVLNGKIYVIGGAKGDPTEEYDPPSDTWTAKSSIPGDHSKWYFETLVSLVTNGNIYVISYPYSPGVRTVNQYDPATDSWQQWQTAKIMWRTRFCYASANGKLYIIGGVAW